jgi:hypothetical protein
MKATGRAVFLAIAASLPFALLACGPAGASIGDACPDQPLYKWEYDGSTKAWTRVHVGDGGEPLSDDELTAIAQANQHCLTPAGNATTLSPNDAGTATPLDASRD